MSLDRSAGMPVIPQNGHRPKRLGPGGLPGATTRLLTAPKLPWVDWALAIAGRYTGGIARRRPLGMILLRRLASGAFVRQIVHWRPILLPARYEPGGIALRATEANERFKPRATGHSTAGMILAKGLQPGMASLGSRPWFEREPGQRAIHRPATVLTEQLVQRILTRSERREAFLPARAVRQSLQPVYADRQPYTQREPGSPAPEARAISRPPALVFHSQARSQDAEGTLEAPHKTNRHPVPPAPPEVDVNRLTDQVIQTIDRRLAAWRERMGRI